MQYEAAWSAAVPLYLLPASPALALSGMLGPPQGVLRDGDAHRAVQGCRWPCVCTGLPAHHCRSGKVRHHRGSFAGYVQVLKPWPEAKHGLTPCGWGLTKKKPLCALEHGRSMWSQQITAVRRRGCPGLGWSPPGASFVPTAVRVFGLSSQQALKLSNKHHFSHLERARLLPALHGEADSNACASSGAGRGGQSSRKGEIPGAVPIQGDGVVGVGAGGRGLQALPGSVPAQLCLEPSRWGRLAAVVACLASPHLSGIRCSIAGNSQRIPAPNCSRLSSFSQGLSRCVGDAG